MTTNHTAQSFTLRIDVVLTNGQDMSPALILDALCGTLGDDNGSPRPHTFRVSDGDHTSTYQVKSADTQSTGQDRYTLICDDPGCHRRVATFGNARRATTCRKHRPEGGWVEQRIA